MSKYIVYAISNNGDGKIIKVSEYQELSDIKINIGMYADDVVIEIEDAS